MIVYCHVLPLPISCFHLLPNIPHNSNTMPQKKKSPFQKYKSAQNSIKTILTKYNGSRQTILTGRTIFLSSKDERYRQHSNDCRNLQRFEKIVKEYEESLLSITPSTPQDPTTTTATAARGPQDPPYPHLNRNHCHNNVSIFSTIHLYSFHS